MNVVRTTQRRSIVTFEKWLDAEIATAEAALQGLLFEAEAVAVKQGGQTVRLETLRNVKAKLAKTPVEAEGEDEAPLEAVADLLSEA